MCKKGLSVRDLIKCINGSTPLTDKNRFPMPFIIEPDDAARRIRRGLDGRGFEITFPKRLSYVLKTLQRLPYALYFPLIRRIAGGRS